MMRSSFPVSGQRIFPLLGWNVCSKIHCQGVTGFGRQRPRLPLWKSLQAGEFSEGCVKSAFASLPASVILWQTLKLSYGDLSASAIFRLSSRKIIKWSGSRHQHNWRTVGAPFVAAGKNGGRIRDFSVWKLPTAYSHTNRTSWHSQLPAMYCDTDQSLLSRKPPASAVKSL